MFSGLFSGHSCRRERPSRRALAAGAALMVILAPPARSAPVVSDPDVARGIRLVEEGEFDAAILALDGATRRLDGAGRSPDLAQAYLYLGVAYLGKGHETSARARFRDALQQVHDLRLSPEAFAPKVIEVFEKARAEEESRLAAAPARSAAAGSSETGGRRKGGSKKGLVLAGVGLAAAGGIAAAAGGGGGSAGPGTSPNTPGRRTETFTGSLEGSANLTFPFTVAGAGSVDARVTWPEPAAALALDLYAPSAGVVATSTRSGSSASLTSPVTTQEYRLQLLHRGGCVAAPPPAPPCSATYTLTITHP